MADDDIKPFPLFAGACRVPTVFGVPMMPLLVAVGLVAMIAMWISLWWWLFLIPVVVIMRLITKHDDRAFSIWWLWFETRGRNRVSGWLRGLGWNQGLWGGSSYAPTNYRHWRRK